MVEKRISTAFGIPPHVHPKGPTIVLPENPHSIPGGLTLEEYSRYKRIYKREPIYHQKDLVQDIGKIFTDLGFPPATRLSLANADLLVSALKILYTNEKYIHLNMWPATREFLKKAGVAIPTP